MQDAYDWTSDGSQYDDHAEVEAPEMVVPANFDPLVQDALQSTGALGALADDTLASLPAQPLPTGPFTGLDGALPGGSGTADIAGFVNGGGADLTDLINTAVDGRELSPEQIAKGEHIASRGIDTSPLEINDRLEQSVTESEREQRYKEAAHKAIMDAIPELTEVDGAIDGAQNSINRSDVEISRGPTLRPRWGSAF